MFFKMGEWQTQRYILERLRGLQCSEKIQEGDWRKGSSMETKAMAMKMRTHVGPARGSEGEKRFGGYSLAPICMCCIQGDPKASRWKMPAENRIVRTAEKLFLLLLSSRSREWRMLPKEECTIRRKEVFGNATFRCPKERRKEKSLWQNEHRGEEVAERTGSSRQKEGSLEEKEFGQNNEKTHGVFKEQN